MQSAAHRLDLRSVNVVKATGELDSGVAVSYNIQWKVMCTISMYDIIIIHECIKIIISDLISQTPFIM